MFRAAATSRCTPLVIAALFLFSPAASRAFDLNGFLPAAGEGNVALSYTAESWDHFWLGETRVADPGVGEVDIASLSLWFNYGLDDRFSLVGSLASVDAESDGLARFGEQDLQDLSLLLQARLARSGDEDLRHTLVAAAGVRTPLTGYPANLPVDVGDGTTDALLRLVYLLEVHGFYFAQQVGYDLRGEDAPDGLPLFTEIGHHFGQLTVSAFFSSYIADGGTDIGDPGFTFPSNQEEYQRAGLKVYARLSDRFGVSLCGFDTLDGRNTGETSGLSAGVNLRF